MTKPAETVTIQALCGNCALWRVIEMAGPVEIGSPKRGNCFALPPTPVAIFGADRRQILGQVNLRPAVLETESCGMFTPRMELLQPDLVTQAVRGGIQDA